MKVSIILGEKGNLAKGENKTLDAIVDTVLKFKQDFESFPDAENLILSATELKPGIFTFKVRLTNASKTTLLYLNRVLSLPTEKSGGFLKNELAEISASLQGQGFGKVISKLSLALADELGIKTIKLNANIDVGGYAWLRKGYWPTEGKSVLDAIAENNNYADAKLVKEWLALSDWDARSLAVTKEMGKFKTLFLGSDWDGSGDVTSERFRSAMLGEELKVTPIAPPVEEPANVVIPTIPIPPINLKIRDSLIKHQAYLLRVSSSIRDNMSSLLEDSEASILGTVASRKFSITALASRADWEKMNLLQATVGNIRKGAWEKASSYLMKNLVDLAYYEPEFMQTMLKTVLPITPQFTSVERATLKSILDRQTNGKTVDEWVSSLQAQDISRIHAIIQQGILDKKTSAQIAELIVGTNVLPGATAKTVQQLNPLAWTGVQHVTTQARSVFNNANTVLFKQDRFVATLDSHTTLTCATKDGNVYPIGEGPVPPLHYNCRSLRVPEISAEYMETRPMKPQTEKMLLNQFCELNGLKVVTDRSKLPRGFKTNFDKWARAKIRASVNTTSANEKFEPWFKKQSWKFQNEYLGKTKAELYRKGGIELSRFITDTGKPLTLDQLKQLESEAWIKAFGR